jgi:hypothetical protein
MISYSVSGDTHNTEAFLAKMMRGDLYTNIEPLAQRGVEALRAATPRDTGATADAWSYEIQNNGGAVTIWWKNGNIENGFNVAIGLQYGHGTGTGGWIEGYDYINPALRPIFDQIADGVWKEVQKA